uniref:Uncharacterized protein n=1 Tax=Strigamia maritima TaxID=126957 RepID=T1JCG2_STRMM
MLVNYRKKKLKSEVYHSDEFEKSSIYFKNSLKGILRLVLNYRKVMKKIQLEVIRQRARVESCDSSTAEMKMMKHAWSELDTDATETSEITKS